MGEAASRHLRVHRGPPDLGVTGPCPASSSCSPRPPSLGGHPSASGCARHAASGVVRSGARLAPGTRLVRDDGVCTVAEAAPLWGFVVVEVEDARAALALAGSCPGTDPGTVELYRLDLVTPWARRLPMLLHCDEVSEPSPRRRARGPRPARVGARRRHARPPARQRRPRRGDLPGEPRRGARALAGRGHPGEPRGVALAGGQEPGARRAPPRPALADEGGRPDARAGARGHGPARAAARGDRGRPAPARLHVLPSRARAREPGGDHAPARLRPHHRPRSRAPSSSRSPRSRSGSCAPSGRSRSGGCRTSCRRGGARRAALVRARGRLPRVQRGLQRERRRRAPARRPDARGDRSSADLLAELLPDESEVHGLVALMELQGSRGAARTDADGNLVLLEDQDRRRWDRAWIARGLAHLERARATETPGPTACRRRSRRATRSRRGVGRDRLAADRGALRRARTAGAVAGGRAEPRGRRSMVDGPAAGLAIVDGLRDAPRLRDYHLLPATRADLLRRLGAWAEARAEYARALSLAQNRREQEFLARRVAECAAHLARRPREARPRR